MNLPAVLISLLALGLGCWAMARSYWFDIRLSKLEEKQEEPKPKGKEPSLVEVRTKRGVTAMHATQAFVLKEGVLRVEDDTKISALYAADEWLSLEVVKEFKPDPAP